MAHTCGSSQSRGWGSRIIWTQESGITVRRDRATAQQPGQHSEWDSFSQKINFKKRYLGKNMNWFMHKVLPAALFMSAICWKYPKCPRCRLWNKLSHHRTFRIHRTEQDLYIIVWGGLHNLLNKTGVGIQIHPCYWYFQKKHGSINKKRIKMIIYRERAQGWKWDFLECTMLNHFDFANIKYLTYSKN